jgi:putative ABC transport system permease protein
LVRQLLTESLALALAGGIAGGLLTVVGLPIVARVAGPMMPIGTTVHLDAPTFAWSGAVSLLTVLLIGLLPALFASRADFTATVQAGGQRASSARGEPRLHRSFVAAEIALSLVLVIGAVLLIQSFVRLRHVEIGFDPAHVLSIDARIPLFRFSRTMDIRSRFLLAEEERRLVKTLRAVPGIQAIAVASEPPLGRRSIATEVTMRGGQRSVAAYHRISPGYFATLGVPLVSGRDFDDRDAVREDQYADLRHKRGQGALIVNETAARVFWPGSNALGQSVSTGVDFAVSRRTVVGVVRDTRSQAVEAPPGPEVYAPYLEDPSFAMTFLVRTPLPIAQALPSLQRAMRSVDPEISTANERTLDEIVNGASGSSRISAAVVALFATVALVLSAIGIYGMLAFTVSRRTREFGIRMALGADRHDISRLLLRETALAITVGLIAGIGGALAMTRWTSSLLFGVGSRDPWSFAIAVGCLALICLIAGYIPVRTAGQTDAAEALKTE